MRLRVIEIDPAVRLDSERSAPRTGRPGGQARSASGRPAAWSTARRLRLRPRVCKSCRQQHGTGAKLDCNGPSGYNELSYGRSTHRSQHAVCSFRLE